jgi:hypothetical protein
MDNYLKRIQEYIDSQRLNNMEVEGKLGISQGLIKKNLKSGSSLSAEKVEIFLREYPEVNPDWLMCGNPPMLRIEKSAGISKEDYNKLKQKNDILEEMLVKVNERLGKELIKIQDLENQLENKKPG